MTSIQEALRAWRAAEARLVELRDSGAEPPAVDAAVRDVAHARHEYEGAAVTAFDQAVPLRHKRPRSGP